MMNRPRVFPCQVDTRLEHIEDEEFLFVYHSPIDDLAFKIRRRPGDERWLDV
jgi:hypothetical protein